MLNVVMLRVVMLSVVMLSVVMPSVIRLSVVVLFVPGRPSQPIIMFVANISMSHSLDRNT